MVNDKWQAFLSDPGFRRIPDGQYLFGKILHDTLACLNDYVYCIDLMASDEINIPPEIIETFHVSKSIVDSLITEIKPFWQQHKSLSISSQEWPNLIREIGWIIEKHPIPANSLTQNLKANDEISGHLFQRVNGNLRILTKIATNIREENYKTLWETLRWTYPKRPNANA